MAINHPDIFQRPLLRRMLLPLIAFILLLLTVDTHGAMLYKNYVVRYDRGWDILCDPYQVQQGDWVLKIFRQKGELAHADFREFLGIFERLNPHVKDIDRIRPGQVVDIPLKKLAQGALPGQASGVVTIPVVMISSPREIIEKHTRSYTIQRGDTVSKLIANRFGGRYGNTTYSQGLALFKAANPHIKDVNRIYAGQKIYMPDPSIREQSWYSALFDEAGNLVEKMADGAETESGEPQPQPTVRAGSELATPQPESEKTGPAAEAASAIGGRLLDKGTYFFPMKQGKDFELDLSRHPMIDLLNGSKVILTTQDRVMNVDLPLIQSYWENVKVVKVPDEATSQDILEAVFSAFSSEASTNRLAFDDGGINISISAKWIRTEPSVDGRVPRHSCITPITSDSERTHDAIVRYLDQNDIVIKELLSGAPEATRPPLHMEVTKHIDGIDGSSQKALIESFATLMGFNYSPNTSISFPYAGIQVQALSNLLSFGNGREILIDFGNLYGDAVNAIRDTGLEILQINLDAEPLEIIQRLMKTAGMAYTASPVFYGANRSPEFNTAISVSGILIPMENGENRLFTDRKIPELIRLFLRDRGIRLIRIEGTARG
ncbi:LysM peptidoglycan-binding domain-containing protein [uncultured Desulfosarcina sp.]|uniref:LysM peptidoglycan-binding domain-containing protein n=1 Tax=uncultured Desulfosarcina sp. TaxID=218289 RepID=UPI0029C6705C|nr:LysM peptidoglycan-binding domain-containing protein [uncultured Desulfosarcina sp.]